jgi:predicted dehydrogenase
MSDPIRLALIGAGLIVEKMHWPALQRLRDEFRIVAVADLERNKAQALIASQAGGIGPAPSVYEDYRALLNAERPDAVLVALPPGISPTATEAALVAGCHVIAEKPIAVSLDQGERMSTWPHAYGRVFMIAENYRYLTGYRRAAQWIADGAIGSPVAARWSLFAYEGPDSPFYQRPWRLNPVHPGGYLSDGGVHDAAALRMLLGEVDTVVAQTAQVRPDMPPADTISSTLHFACGALGTYAVTYAVPGPETPLQISGTAGVLSVWRERVSLWRPDADTQEWAEPAPERGAVAMHRDFARAIRTGHAPISTPAEALADLRLIVAMLRAAETGNSIQVAGVRS